ncbi:hypothetical protein GS506_13055 [Rhodococcus hoagii]|nr:hypothetical protein [Prescottella equi]
MFRRAGPDVDRFDAGSETSDLASPRLPEGAVRHCCRPATGPLNRTVGAAQRWESDSTLLPWPKPRAVVTNSLTPPPPGIESRSASRPGHPRARSRVES